MILPSPTRYTWLAESPSNPGLYAVGEGSALCTRVAHEARTFSTRTECQRWCDDHPVPRWEPREHGFVG